MIHLDEEEQEEYDALLADAIGDVKEGTKATRRLALRFHELLLDAEQAGRRWAGRVLDEDAIAGHEKRLNKALDVVATTLVSHDGKLIGKSMRRGVRRRKSDGAIEATRMLFHEMSWDELRSWFEMIEQQIAGLLVNRTVANKLLSLEAKFPTTYGPAEAAARAGTTIEALLGGDVAA